MDEQSGKSEEEEVMGEGIGESEVEELVPEWGWRRDKYDTIRYINVRSNADGMASLI